MIRGLAIPCCLALSACAGTPSTPASSPPGSERERPPAPAAKQGAAPPSAAPAPTREGLLAQLRGTLLVVPLRTDEELEGIGPELDPVIVGALPPAQGLRILSPADIDAILGAERLREALGCDDLVCYSNLAGALDARYLITGQLTALSGQAVLSLALIDAEEIAVLGRAVARGGEHGDTPPQLARFALAALLGAPIVDPTPPATEEEDEATPAYAEMLSEFALILARSQWSALLEAVARYERSGITAPNGVDLAQLYAFYRLKAAFELGQPAAPTQARLYLKRWPDGTYAAEVHDFLRRLQDHGQAHLRSERRLSDALHRIHAEEGAGQLGRHEASQQRAEAYFQAGRHKEAIEILTALLPTVATPRQYMEVIDILTLVLERSGQRARAHSHLRAAEARDPALFRQQGLHERLRRLSR